MVYDPNAVRRSFGEIAQRANPQVSDPSQNLNLAGFPAGDQRFSELDKRLNQGTTSTVPARFSGNTAALQPAPGAAPAAGGAYTGEGYQPIGDEEAWAGRGFSGGDPREAAAQLEDKRAAEEAELEPPAGIPPGAQGGKGGAAAQAAQGAGFTPPGGAGGGKGGGADPAAGGAPAAPTDKTGTPEPGSNIVPAGDIGNTGIDPDDPIQYDDTGDYDDSTGFAPGFESKYTMKQGAPGQIVGHDKNPEAKARLQKIADRRLKEWTDAGGDPSNFMTFNPEQGQYAKLVPGWDKMTPEQKWGARQTERGNFYDQQIAALRGAKKPGVQK
jgi:hypothetical protein